MTFTLFDIKTLKQKFEESSINDDCLKSFLNKYSFESVYSTEDNTLVFYAGGKNKIEIEFCDFNNPVARTCSILYYENGKPEIIYF